MLRALRQRRIKPEKAKRRAPRVNAAMDGMDVSAVHVGIRNRRLDMTRSENYCAHSPVLDEMERILGDDEHWIVGVLGIYVEHI